MSPRGEKHNEQMRLRAVGEITRAALQVFAEYGYHGATMKVITERSGLSKGLVYHYFASKQDMFLHMVDTALAISRDTWNEVLNGPGTAWEKIERISESLVRVAFTEENSAYFLIMTQALTQGRADPRILRFIAERSTHYNELPALIREAQKTGQAAGGDPDVMASTYLALFQGYTLMLSIDKGLLSRVTPKMFTDVLRPKAHPE
jgi:AcrR family transcriptional regulator